MRILCALLMTVATLTASDYSPVKSWAGSGTKETESFDITAKEWRLAWTAEAIDKTFAGDGRRILSVAVMKDGSAVPVSSMTAGDRERSGETFVRGAGHYYLKVTAVNAQWTLAAEQAK